MSFRTPIYFIALALVTGCSTPQQDQVVVEPITPVQLPCGKREAFDRALLAVKAAVSAGSTVNAVGFKPGMVHERKGSYIVDGSCVVDGQTRFEYHGQYTCMEGQLMQIGVTWMEPLPEWVKTQFDATCSQAAAADFALTLLTISINPERRVILPDTSSLSITWDEVASYSVSGEFTEDSNTTSFIVGVTCFHDKWSYNLMGINGLPVHPGQVY